MQKITLDELFLMVTPQDRWVFLVMWQQVDALEVSSLSTPDPPQAGEHQLQDDKEKNNLLHRFIFFFLIISYHPRRRKMLFGKSAHNWMRLFWSIIIDNRAVKIDNFLSSFPTISCGVPHGSIPDTILFALHVLFHGSAFTKDTIPCYCRATFFLTTKSNTGAL